MDDPIAEVTGLVDDASDTPGYPLRCGAIVTRWFPPISLVRPF